jgi:16S rRNA (cytidine1402-2'-O)-methyltransferase
MTMEKEMKQGVLYVVSTPIGNLEDITFRAVRVLKKVRLIAAEDTRRAKILLAAYDIHTPITSLHDWNEARKGAALISRIHDGFDVAYVSDAGTPLVSDPGYLLVRKAIEAGIKVVPVPGVSAVTAAMSVAGLPSDRFSFSGFLPAKESQRRHFLDLLRNMEETLIFFESPRRLLSSLKNIEEILGDREIVITRELTKLFEEIYRGKVSEIRTALKDMNIRGEITLLIAGRKKVAPTNQEEEIISRFEKLKKTPNLSIRDIVDRISGEVHLPRKTVYRAVLQTMRDTQN